MKQQISQPVLTRGVGVLLLAVLGLSACSSTPVPSYYTITPTVSPLAHHQVKAIELLPVAVPDRLDRSQIVIQDTNGKSLLLDNQRWSSALSAELHDGLSSGLQQALGAVDRYNSGMVGYPVAYRIATDFSRFDVLKAAPVSKLPLAVDSYSLNVAVAWMIKRLDPAQALVATAGKPVPDPSRQLSCRMSFTLAVNNHSRSYIPDVVAASRQSLSRIVEAMAQSVILLDQATGKVAIPDVSCV